MCNFCYNFLLYHLYLIKRTWIHRFCFFTMKSTCPLNYNNDYIKMIFWGFIPWNDIKSNYEIASFLLNFLVSFKFYFHDHIIMMGLWYVVVCFVTQENDVVSDFRVIPKNSKFYTKTFWYSDIILCSCSGRSRECRDIMSSGMIFFCFLAEFLWIEIRILPLQFFFNCLFISDFTNFCFVGWPRKIIPVLLSI